MKISLIIIGSITVLLLLSLLVLAYQSRTAPPLGLIDDALRPCPFTQNCVNSQAKDKPAAIAPLRFTTNPATAWQTLEKRIKELDGIVQTQTGHYLWATFSSPLLGFVDDLEVMMDEKSQLFHVRSASRVGRSDFSANQKRIEALRQTY